MNLEQRVHSQLDTLPGKTEWWLALSGGLDSCVLANLLATYLQKQSHRGVRLRAIHIDHQLQPGSADWAGHCHQVCDRLSIPLVVERVVVERVVVERVVVERGNVPRNADSKNRGKGLEAAAREQRYAAFARHCPPGAILFTAHHRDDQAETVLLRLLRGAGIRGASGIAAQREIVLGHGLDANSPTVTACRPLLPFSREELQDWASESGVAYIEDPSNADQRFDRNFLRHAVLPLLESRWSGSSQNLARFAEQCARSQGLLEELAQIDLAEAGAEVDCYGPSLSLVALSSLSARRQANLLRYWLDCYRVNPPSERVTRQIIENLLPSRSSQATVQLERNSLCIHRQRLYLVDDSYRGARNESQQWHTGENYALASLGCLQASPAAGQEQGLKDGTYRIGFREAGDSYRTNGMTRSLKKLFNECCIPVWLRDYYPVIYAGNDIAAVGDILVCEDFCTTGGWRLDWQYHLHDRTMINPAIDMNE